MNEKFGNDEWGPDTPKVREYDGKLLHIKKGGVDHGVFRMRVVEIDPKTGETKPGYVKLMIEPYDLKSAMVPLPKL